MTNNNLLLMIPSVEPDELAYLQEFTKGMSEEKLKTFITLYNSKRKKAEMILICALIGFVGFNGIHRFVMGQVGMGVLYFLTAGLCFIGTIVDIINHKSLTFEYNQKMAVESMNMIGGF